MLDATLTTKDSSAQAFKSLHLPVLKTMGDQIEWIVRNAIRAGALNLTRREIQARYESTFMRRIDANSVSARVNALVAAKRLQEHPESRKCSITGHDVSTLCLPSGA